MATVEDESFMVACLKMAKAYVKVVCDELRLYSSKPGHKPIEVSFVDLQRSLEERIGLHTGKLQQLMTPAPPAKPKVKLKNRTEHVAPKAQTVIHKNKIPARKSGLKKRVV